MDEVDLAMKHRKALSVAGGAGHGHTHLAVSMKKSSRASASAASPRASEHHGLHHCRRKCVCPASDEGRQAHFPRVWSELRLSEQLCDGAIRCGDGKRLKVHRAILSAVSPYFKALFTNSLHGGQPETREVAMAERADALRPILDFAYTGQCGVSARNVEALLPLADRLGVVGAVQQCCQFLLREMQPDNCLGVFRFARQYFCHDLEASGRRYILHHFSEVLHQSAELYELTGDELCRLLADDGLNVRDEALVFEAARRWVDRDVAARCQHLAALLACVRLGFTSLRFLTDTVLAYGPIRDDQALHSALAPARAFLCAAEAEGGARAMDAANPLARPRVPFEILLAVGGWSAGSPTNFVETYDCRADRWCVSPCTDALPRAYHGMVVLDGLVYMIGGYDGTEYFKSVRSFDPATHEWREQACMYQARCHVSVCTLAGQIYALGGYDGRTRTKSAEAYDPRRNQWRLLEPMHKARSDASAASLNGKVYIAGGYCGGLVLSSAEVFDPETGQWTLIASMASARSGVSLLAHRGALYALGGFNGSGTARLRTAERLDPAEGKWQPVPDMLQPRSNFAAVVLDDLIYVIGGFNGTVVSNTECLDVNTNEWRVVQPMNLNRSGLAAVVLAGLPTAEEHSFLHVLQQDHGAEGQ